MNALEDAASLWSDVVDPDSDADNLAALVVAAVELQNYVRELPTPTGIALDDAIDARTEMAKAIKSLRRAVRLINNHTDRMVDAIEEGAS